MKIIVCIKQVPGTNQVEVDETTGVLKRDGVESKVNPYDLYALEAAVRLKEQLPGTSTVALTMGPPQAEESLREGFMMGMDEAVLVSDRRFAGADVLATSRALSQAMLAIGDPGLIICGQMTTDGDTAQVGPEIAEFLDIPHAANVTKIHELTQESIMVDMYLPGSVETLRIPLPALITVNKGIHTPRLPSFKLKKKTQSQAIRTLTLDDMPDSNPAHYGLDGAPTQVIRIFPPEHHVDHERWEGTSAELSERLHAHLQEHKFLGAVTQ